MSINVLLVDDEPGLTEALSKRLSKRGYTVHEADSGKGALDLLDRGTGVDVVVLDVRMAGVNGLETLHRIKSAYSGVEVVMLSAYATPQCAVECRRWGARDFLRKPVHLEELVAAIDAAASSRHPRPQ
ncbi:response regulator [Maridesulfovibrio sp.]|uniref:response regulator n=1 Tax=Maridesulfovibrio sp. TaxID=2795000 RepID=UPI002A18AF29|nr:response regulator [Maridesulfovibrio sp.]